MSSQNSDNKNSLAKISNYVLGLQVDTINAYTSGHLNENHLWKPTRHEQRKDWDYKSISGRLDRASSNEHMRTRKLLTEYQRHVMLSRCEEAAEAEEGRSQSARNYHRDDQEDNGDGDGEGFLSSRRPISDKEMSLKILSSHLAKGTTKTEKLNNMLLFQNNFIKKGTRFDKLAKKYNPVVSSSFFFIIYSSI